MGKVSLALVSKIKRFLVSKVSKRFFFIKEQVYFNPLSANPTKWSNTLKQFVGKLSTNWLSVFEHFVKLALKGLKTQFLVIIRI